MVRPFRYSDADETQTENDDPARMGRSLRRMVTEARSLGGAVGLAYDGGDVDAQFLGGGPLGA